MATRKSKAKTPNTETGEVVESADNASYAVGYRRPPEDTRFKPGKSGNPKGRPPGRANAKTTIARVINEKVPVREGEHTRRMTKLEAMLQSHTMKAMKGDARSAGLVIGLVTRTGLLNDQEEEILAALSDEDAAIASDFLRRNAKKDPEQQ